MESDQEEYGLEPVSPNGQYFNSSVLSVFVLCVLESKVPINDSPAITLLKDVFLPISPRFSSIMVTDKNGSKKWKRVEVKLKDHVKIPCFPSGLSPESYDQYLSEYLSNIGTEQLPQSQPLWDIHIIKYPTSTAAGCLVFKLHHALGDGYSLMGALLSCLHRADDPSLPLTFPSSKSRSSQPHYNNALPRLVSSVFNSISDFGLSLLKSSFREDDPTPIRSGNPMVQYLPITITTITFSLDQIKQVKTNLKATVNDVVTGIVFLGTRLYMQAMDNNASKRSKSTALVMLNTRMVDGYKSVKEMLPHDCSKPPIWENQFAFLQVSIPELSTSDQSLNPLQFVRQAQEMIKAKRSSIGFLLIARLLELMRKYRGPEVAAKYIHRTIKNTSVGISNLIGPVEEMSLANHPVSGLYFMMVGGPHSLTVTIVSYMGKLRIAIGGEKDFIDPHAFKKSIQCAFEMILKAATETPSQQY